MSATATMRHTVTLPKKASAFLTRKAKSGNTTVSSVIVTLIDDYNERMEDLRLSAILAKREAESDGKYISHEDAWK